MKGRGDKDFPAMAPNTREVLHSEKKRMGSAEVRQHDWFDKYARRVPRDTRMPDLYLLKLNLVVALIDWRMRAVTIRLQYLR